jgi:transcriptional regulator with XRE-family HTH domain
MSELQHLETPRLDDAIARDTTYTPARRIVGWRGLRGLKQDAAARQMGIGTSALKGLERDEGPENSPLHRTLEAVHRETGIPPEHFRAWIASLREGSGHE